MERSGATWTLLDGPACRSDPAPGYCGKVLLVGGTAGGALPTDPGARVELYDPATGKWGSCDATTSPSADCPAPYAGAW